MRIIMKMNFLLMGRILNSTDQAIGLGIDSGWEGTGKYLLGLKQDNQSYAVFIDNNKNCTYRTDTIHSGKLTITHFDSSKRIVSGQFHFTAVLKQVSYEKDTIRVTQGRFDIQD